VHGLLSGACQNFYAAQIILNPPPPTIESVLEGLEEGKDAKGGKDAGKGGAKGDAKAGGKAGGKGGAGAGEEAGEGVEERIPSVFIPPIEAAVQDFVSKWQDKDEANNFFQHHDADLIKQELRPIVFEEIRQQVNSGLGRGLDVVWFGVCVWVGAACVCS
jgi:hypothetical protein